MNLAGIDLNLLLVFDAIMTERHVTRAGDKIGMSQPAMSNALNRLRHHLKDELFVRGHEGMRPTPRALELAAPINEALLNLSSALDPIEFDPSVQNRTFSIGTNDYCAVTLMPHVIKQVQTEAPGINIRLMPSAGKTFDLLDSQAIDVGISSFSDIPKRFDLEELFEDSYVLVMRKDHPFAKGDLLLTDYLDARHMIISPHGDPQGFVDIELAKKGKLRRVVATVNSFSGVPSMLTNSDLILTTPKRIADTFVNSYPLTTRPSPFAGPREYSSATLVWHARLGSHPAHHWFRGLLKRVAETL